VFLNGRIWTADPRRPRAQALAVAGDTDRRRRDGRRDPRYVGPATTTVDLRGRFVAPGFNDAHLHFLVVETVDLTGAASVEEIQRRIRAYAPLIRTALDHGPRLGLRRLSRRPARPQQLDAAVADRPPS
jgi:predicted amidohydrolase YtcJ